MGIDDDGMERGRVGPASDREEDFEMSILLLEFKDGFEVAIEVVPAFIPGVAGIVDIFVRPDVGQEHLAGVSSHIGESVQDVSS